MRQAYAVVLLIQLTFAIEVGLEYDFRFACPKLWWPANNGAFY